MEEFLGKNPTEFILLRLGTWGVDPVDSISPPPEPFQEDYRGHALSKFENAPALLWEDYSCVCGGGAGGSWPTVGAVRGRVLVWQGPLASSSCPGCVVQDLWATGDASLKVEKIFEHSETVRSTRAEQGLAGGLSVSFLSCGGRSGGGTNMDYVTPAAMALRVNEEVLNRLGELVSGVYLIDFPGGDLVQRLIQRNFE